MSKKENVMHSFTMPCSVSERNEKMVRKACEMRLEELQHAVEAERIEMEKAGKPAGFVVSVNFKFEVMVGMDNIRVNLYGANSKDVAMVGYNFCALQMNPTWT